MTDIIGTMDLGPLFAQRVASPEVARAAMPGAGQRARSEARERSRRGSWAAYNMIGDALAVHGPQTRKELAVATGLCINTINGRVSELRELPVTDPYRVHTDGRRNGESIVHLSRLTPAPENAP